MKVAILLTVLMLFTVTVQAEDEIKYSGALKVWDAQASQPGSHNSATETSAASSAGNISLTAKKSDYFVTASTLLPATYNFGTDNFLQRHDLDIAAGWRFYDIFSALIGQKQLTYFAPGSSGNQNIRATYLGLSAAKLISDKSFLYGTATYSIKASNSLNQPDSRYKQNFATYEFGYGYAMDKTTQLTVGYRAQQYYTKDNTFGYSETDKITGFIFGANFNFN